MLLSLGAGGAERCTHPRACHPDQSRHLCATIAVTHLSEQTLIYHLSGLTTWPFCLKHWKRC